MYLFGLGSILTGHFNTLVAPKKQTKAVCRINRHNVYLYEWSANGQVYWSSKRCDTPTWMNKTLNMLHYQLTWKPDGVLKVCSCDVPVWIISMTSLQPHRHDRKKELDDWENGKAWACEKTVHMWTGASAKTALWLLALQMLFPGVTWCFSDFSQQLEQQFQCGWLVLTRAVRHSCSELLQQ